MIFCDFSLEELSNAKREIKREGNIRFKNLPALDSLTRYQMYKTQNTILIRKKEHDFYRLFAFSNDMEDLEFCLFNLPKNDYLLNIPTKDNIEEQKSFLQKCGFELYGTYERFYNKKIIKRDEESGEYAKPNDMNDIKEMLYKLFSVYTDYLPNDEELSGMIKNKQIVVNRYENGTVGGFVIFTIEGSRGYINVWADQTGNGIPLMYKTYNIFEELNVNYVYFWINSLNRNVMILHKMMGALPDGLKDYTFIKK